MNEQQIIDIILKQMQFDVVTLGFKLMVAYAIIVFFKNMVGAIVDFVTFRLDKNISTGTPLTHGRFTGCITDMGLFFVTITSECGDLKRVRIADWWKEPVVFLNTKTVCRDRG